jgi:hypothetical protein
MQRRILNRRVSARPKITLRLAVLDITLNCGQLKRALVGTFGRSYSYSATYLCLGTAPTDIECYYAWLRTTSTAPNAIFWSYNGTIYTNGDITDAIAVRPAINF